MSVFDFLKCLHHDCLELLPRIKFEKYNAIHKVLLSQYSSLIELVGSILVLLENNARIGVPVITRTFLETYVDFHILVRDPNYINYINAISYKEWLRVLEKSRSTVNKHLMELSAHPNFEKNIAEFKAALQNFKNQGIIPLKIYDRFEKANMIEEYDSIYNRLCAEAHSDKSSLINRHFEINGADYNLVIYNNGPSSDSLLYLLVSAEYLISATVSIHDKFKTDAIDEVALFRIEFEKVKATNKEGVQ